MTKLQLLLFSWIAAWVLAEAVSPGIGYEGKMQASFIAFFATVLASGVYRDFIKVLSWWKR